MLFTICCHCCCCLSAAPLAVHHCHTLCVYNKSSLMSFGFDVNASVLKFIEKHMAVFECVCACYRRLPCAATFTWMLTYVSWIVCLFLIRALSSSSSVDVNVYCMNEIEIAVRRVKGEPWRTKLCDGFRVVRHFSKRIIGCRTISVLSGLQPTNGRFLSLFRTVYAQSIYFCFSWLL